MMQPVSTAAICPASSRPPEFPATAGLIVPVSEAIAPSETGVTGSASRASENLTIGDVLDYQPGLAIVVTKSAGSADVTCNRD